MTVGSSTVTAQTRNISCGGVLCELAQSVALMTKLEVVLQLPAMGKESPAALIRCVGVVVRQEPRTASGGKTIYLTGIYFSELTAESHRHIANFVLQSMLSHGRRDT